MRKTRLHPLLLAIAPQPVTVWRAAKHDPLEERSTIRETRISWDAVARMKESMPKTVVFK
jgi:hypothetical protein